VTCGNVGKKEKKDAKIVFFVPLDYYEYPAWQLRHLKGETPTEYH